MIILIAVIAAMLSIVVLVDGLLLIMFAVGMIVRQAVGRDPTKSD